MCDRIYPDLEKANGASDVQEPDESRRLTEGFFKSVFRKFDKNRNGTIEKEEIREQIEINYEISDQTARKIYQFADQDRDGTINYNEFKLFFCRYKALFDSYLNQYVSIFVARDQPVLKRRETLTGQYYKEQKFTKYTLLMITLSITQIILFFTPWKDRLYFKHDKRLQLWRYVTYMFTHNSIFHLTINVVIQIAVGIPLEMVHQWRVIVIYFAGILGGSLFHSTCYPLEDLAGASPGAYAIITAHIAKIILNFREVTHAVTQLIVFAIFTILNTIYNYMVYRDNKVISYTSHVGGAVCGLLVGILCLKNLRVQEFEKVIWWISFALYMLMMVVLISMEVVLKQRHIDPN